MNQKTATVISEKMSPENKILTVTAGPESNHYLVLLNENNNKKAYTIISDFYGKKKKNKSELPVKYRDSRVSRYFIQRNEGDSILSVISSGNEISICFTDQEGKSEVYKQINNPGILTIGTGIKAAKPFIIGLAGRNKPAEIGTIKILSY